MILLRRVLPFLIPMVIIGNYAGLLIYPSFWMYWVTSIFCILVLTVLIVVEWKWKSSSFWLTLAPLLVVAFGGTGLLFFIKTHTFQMVFIAIIVLLIGMYLENVFIFYYQPQQAARFSLANISFLLYVFGGFALVSFGFAIQLLQIVPSWFLAIVGGLFGSMMLLHLLLQYHVWKEGRLHLLVIMGVLVGEVIWVLHFWPTAYFINGFFVAILLYCVPSLIQMLLREVLNRRIVIRYVSISSLAMLLVLFTAQWS